jgi:hypothetical protein
MRLQLGLPTPPLPLNLVRLNGFQLVELCLRPPQQDQLLLRSVKLILKNIPQCLHL